MVNGVVTDSNWQGSEVQMVEELVGDTLMRTGYQVVSQDGEITRIVYIDYEAASDDEKIVYVEKREVDPLMDVYIAPQTLRDLILGDLKDDPSWNQQPIYRVQRSFQSFEDASRVVEDDFYSVTNQEETSDILLTIDLTDPANPQYLRITPVEREEVLTVVPFMRDAAMRAAATLALSDPDAVFYKVESQTNEVVYQWTSSTDPNVSYSISVTSDAPIGSEEAQYTKEASFMTSTRVSRERLFEIYQEQLQMVSDPQDGITSLNSIELTEMENALLSSNALTVFTMQETLDERAGSTYRYAWESTDKLKSYALGDSPVAITQEDESIVYEREFSFSMTQRIARITKDYLAEFKTSATYTAMPPEQRAAFEAALDNSDEETTLFAMTLTSSGYSYTWTSNDGATNTLTRDIQLEEIGTDEQGNPLYRENETFSFSSRGRVSVNEVTGHEQRLTEDRREQYLALELPAWRYDVGVKYGLLTAQLALALSGSDRDQVLATLLELLALRELGLGGR